MGSTSARVREPRPTGRAGHARPPPGVHGRPQLRRAHGAAQRRGIRRRHPDVAGLRPRPSHARRCDDARRHARGRLLAHGDRRAPRGVGVGGDGRQPQRSRAGRAFRWGRRHRPSRGAMPRGGFHHEPTGCRHSLSFAARRRGCRHLRPSALRARPRAATDPDVLKRDGWGIRIVGRGDSQRPGVAAQPSGAFRGDGGADVCRRRAHVRRSRSGVGAHRARGRNPRGARAPRSRARPARLDRDLPVLGGHRDARGSRSAHGADRALAWVPPPGGPGGPPATQARGTDLGPQSWSPLPHM